MLAPTLVHACDLHVELGPIREMGRGRAGARRIVPIVGGTVDGPRLRGRVLDVGADWQTIFGGGPNDGRNGGPSDGPNDGLAELDTRYAMETHDGAVIEIANYGYRFGPPKIIAALARGEDVPPDLYSMRTTARMETGDERYAWVNRTLFVGTGARRRSAVTVSLFAIE